MRMSLQQGRALWHATIPPLPNPQAVRSYAYVQFSPFATDNALSERDIYTCERYSVLDTTENRTRLPSALRHTLQCLSAHCTICESSLDMGIEVPDLLGMWISWKCSFHHGISKGLVPLE